MHIIVVAQNKGGDGKTTLSKLLLEWAGRCNYRALGVDMDPQCNFSSQFLQVQRNAADMDGTLPPVHPDFDPTDTDGWDGYSSTADLFTDKITRFGVFPYPTRIPSVDMLPGHGKGLRDADKIKEDNPLVDRVVMRVKEFFDRPDLQTLYDLAVIDTPPGKDTLVLASVKAATHMVIPTQMAQLSVDGLLGMLQMWRRENRTRRADRAVDLIGIVPWKVKRVIVQQGYLAQLRESPSISRHLTPMVVNQRVAYEEMDSPNAEPQSIFDLPETDKARAEAVAVCQYIFTKAGLTRDPGLSPTKSKEVA